MENTDKKYLLIIGIAIIILIIIIIYIINTNEKSPDVYESLDIVERIDEKATEKELIKVHIAGAVVTEGLVELEEGSRVEDAIKSAGGTTINANIKDINLAQKLQDGQKIYIPEQGEEYRVENTNDNISKIGKININTATQTELELLTGIGPSTAGKIISHRNKNGNFEKIEEIKEVAGIGEAKYEMIKEEITV